MIGSKQELYCRTMNELKNTECTKTKQKTKFYRTSFEIVLVFTIFMLNFLVNRATLGSFYRFVVTHKSEEL